MKKPDVDTFRQVLKLKGGNITQTAEVFKVNRATIHEWVRSDPAFNAALKDQRGTLVDECLQTARFLAMGLAERDSEGKFVGWIERPDSNMIRYLLGTLGRKEGFGDEKQEDNTPTPAEVRKGVEVREWLKQEMTSDKDA